MSAYEAAAALVDGWKESEPAFAIINFANADMVGHTGVIEAAVAAVEAVDECLGRVVEAVHASGGACVVTADHGNADEMLEEDGSPDTAHSLNPVPFVVTADGASLDGSEGILADVAPTVARAARDRAARGDDGPLAAWAEPTGARLPLSAHDHRSPGLSASTSWRRPSSAHGAGCCGSTARWSRRSTPSCSPPTASR